MLVTGGHGFAMDLVVLGMQAAPMERMGVHRTMMDFHVAGGDRHHRGDGQDGSTARRLNARRWRSTQGCPYNRPP